MAWKSLVKPDLSIRVNVGWCLSLARQVLRAPAGGDNAHLAYLNTKYRHSPSEPLPDVPVAVWLGHYGTYRTEARGWETKEWGHVVVWIPGRGFISSPGEGDYPSQEWLPTLDAVIQRFGINKQGTKEGVYWGWSEDISGVRVAINEDQESKPDWEEEMQIISSTSTATQWLMGADGTMIGLPSIEYAQVAQKLIDKTATGINRRELDVVKDIAARFKAARGK